MGREMGSEWKPLSLEDRCKLIKQVISDLELRASVRRLEAGGMQRFIVTLTKLQDATWTEYRRVEDLIHASILPYQFSAENRTNSERQGTFLVSVIPGKRLAKQLAGAN